MSTVNTAKSQQAKESFVPYESLPQAVQEIGKLRITGNVIPPIWFQKLKYKTEGGQAKPYLEAVIILADIRYWYLPSAIEDKDTRTIIGYKKKFSGDKLQQSLQYFSDKYGLSKKQAREAISYLVAKGLIEREFATIYTHTGMAISNVMLVVPNVSAIEKLTYSSDSSQTGSTPLTKRESLPQTALTPLPKRSDPPFPNGQHPPVQTGSTYSESSSKTTTKISSESERPKKINGASLREPASALNSPPHTPSAPVSPEPQPSSPSQPFRLRPGLLASLPDEATQERLDHEANVQRVTGYVSNSYEYYMRYPLCVLESLRKQAERHGVTPGEGLLQAIADGGLPDTEEDRLRNEGRDVR